MRYGIIADIHGNLEAFEQVLSHLKSVDAILCAGDIVGYGPSPSECIELLRETQNKTVAGNHDLGSVGKINLWDFSSDAREACIWTKLQLTNEENDYLKNLPLTETVGKNLVLVHGSLLDPTWEYLLSSKRAEISFKQSDFRICFVGHTHIPVVFQRTATGECEIIKPEPDKQMQLYEEMRYIINPGSVGQPRDGDSRASFAIFDDNAYTLEFFRVAYSVKRTQEKMKKVGLPPFLIERLPFGV